MTKEFDSHGIPQTDQSAEEIVVAKGYTEDLLGNVALTKPRIDNSNETASFLTAEESELNRRDQIAARQLWLQPEKHTTPWSFDVGETDQLTFKRYEINAQGEGLTPHLAVRGDYSETGMPSNHRRFIDNLYRTSMKGEKVEPTAVFLPKDPGVRELLGEGGDSVAGDAVFAIFSGNVIPLDRSGQPRRMMTVPDSGAFNKLDRTQRKATGAILTLNHAIAREDDRVIRDQLQTQLNDLGNQIIQEHPGLFKLQADR